MKPALEVNFDGIVGPTHNYAGLSHGNMASMAHQSLESNPREAVLQGLNKAKALADLGFKQGVLPPQERPHIPMLRRLGFSGTDENVLSKVAKVAPELLLAVSSASSMWAANAATVSPSADCDDHLLHFTPANLLSKFHRSIEAEATGHILRAVFNDPQFFAHHDPLPASSVFGDEGAANHTRLCREYGQPGVEFFVYGRKGFNREAEGRFPARQTLEGCQSIARRHRLDVSRTVYARQNPKAIDAGVFHNDVAAVGNQSVYLYHEEAYVDGPEVMKELEQKFERACGTKLQLIMVPTSKVSLADAVKSYLFNGQILTQPSGDMIMIAPLECQEIQHVAHYIKELLASSPIRHVKYFDLRQSMRNGGGPACLRLRIVLNAAEMAATNQSVFMNDALYARLSAWAQKHYRDRLSSADLADPQLLRESRQALDELTQMLKLDSIFSFQK